MMHVSKMRSSNSGIIIHVRPVEIFIIRKWPGDFRGDTKQSAHILFTCRGPVHAMESPKGGVKTNWIHGWSRARGSSGQLTES